MKKAILILFIGLLSISCNSQNNNEKNDNINSELENAVQNPKGSWKVHKEFDENGNLIKYDSIYTFSSNSKFKDLTTIDKDSLLKSFKSNFYKDFSQFKNQGFEELFTKDSLFNKQFFNDNFFENDFGKDFMEIDKIRQQMLKRQQKFLEKYQSELILPKNKNKE